MHPALAAWNQWWDRVAGLRKQLPPGAQLVRSRAVREQAFSLVEQFFSNVRPRLREIDFAESELRDLDAALHAILKLSQAPNRRSSYQNRLGELRAQRSPLENKLIALATRPRVRSGPTGLEGRILQTLEGISPGLGLSYGQVLDDLRDENRRSYRGTVAELREVLRELLDRLATDKAMNEGGIKPDGDGARFTMRQRANFILRSRGVGEKARKTAADVAERVDAGTVARSVYDRGSAGAHVAATRAEAITLKGYADAVLAELLALHAG